MRIARSLLVATALLALSGCAASVVSGHGAAIAASSASPPSSSPTPTSGSPSSLLGGNVVGADDGSFTVRLPQGWKPTSHRPSGQFVAFYTGPVVDGFGLNVNVVDIDRPGSLGLQGYGEATLKAIVQRFAATVVAAAKPATVDGLQALEYTYRWKFGATQLEQRQTLVIRDGRGYVITYSATPKSFAGELAHVDAIVASWQWT